MADQTKQKEELLLSRKLDLLLLTGQLLIQNLADSNRIDRNMRRVALFMGIPSDQFHMHISYTTLMININDGEYSVTKFRKCFNHGANMDILAEISKLSWQALEQKYALEDYEREIHRIAASKKHYPRWLVVLVVGLACGGFCKLFGCDWPAFFITSVASSIAMFCRQEMFHRNVNVYMSIAGAAFIAVLIAGLASAFDISDTPHHPIFACVLFLIPGLPIINSLDDMLDGFSVVGITRALIIFLTLGAISFGMIFALKILHLQDYAAVLSPRSNWFIIGLAAAVAAIGFAVLFNVPKHTLLVCAIGGAIAVLTRNLLLYNAGFSLPLSSFCGALVVGISSIYVVHLVHVPSNAIAIPPIIPMIPGVLMYKTMIGILSIDASAGLAQVPLLLQTIESGITAAMTVLGLSLGIAIPNVISRKYSQKEKATRLMGALKK